MLKGNKEVGWRNCNRTTEKVMYFVDNPTFQIKRADCSVELSLIKSRENGFTLVCLFSNQNRNNTP